jgi:hypothetical protein
VKRLALLDCLLQKAGAMQCTVESRLNLASERA